MDLAGLSILAPRNKPQPRTLTVTTNNTSNDGSQKSQSRKHSEPQSTAIITNELNYTRYHYSSNLKKSPMGSCRISHGYEFQYLNIWWFLLHSVRNDGSKCSFWPVLCRDGYEKNYNNFCEIKYQISLGFLS